MDYFKELNVKSSNKDAINSISENQELYLLNTEYKCKVESLIICPNCDLEYNSDVGCTCGYGKDLIFDDIDKNIEEENRKNKISESNKGNGEKIELIKGSDNLCFYNYHGRIGKGNAEVELSYIPTQSRTNLLKDRNKVNKRQKFKLYIDYKVVDNDTSRGQSEGKTIISHNIYGFKIYRHKEWKDRSLDEYKIKYFLSNKIHMGKDIEQIVLSEILNDYNYNPDLVSN